MANKAHTGSGRWTNTHWSGRFYKGTRYYVVDCPESWLDTYFVHICSKRCRPDQPQPHDCESFAVYADCLDLVVNAAKNPYGKKAPTIKGLEQAERAKAGIRDVGDPVADLLRGLTMEEMFTVAAKYLGFYEEELVAKYAHLDNGRKRMTLGNRMRAKFKKEGA